MPAPATAEVEKLSAARDALLLHSDTCAQCSMTFSRMVQAANPQPSAMCELGAPLLDASGYVIAPEVIAVEPTEPTEPTEPSKPSKKSYRGG